MPHLEKRHSKLTVQHLLILLRNKIYNVELSHTQDLPAQERQVRSGYNIADKFQPYSQITEFDCTMHRLQTVIF